MIQFHHVSLIVKSTEAALPLYQAILGLELAERPPLNFGGAWLQVGAQQIHLLELANPDSIENRPSHGGRDRHLALSVDDLAETERRLDQAGFAFTRSQSGRQALFFRDVDGNAIELIQKY